MSLARAHRGIFFKLVKRRSFHVSIGFPHLPQISVGFCLNVPNVH